MRVVSADLWEPAPGQVLTWDVLPGAGPAPQPAEPTFNQRNHLLGAAAGEPSVWIAAAFDVDGPVDPDALEAAFRDLVAEHPGLCAEAVRRPVPGPATAGGAVTGATDGGVGLVRHEPGRLVWLRQDGPVTRTAEATREHLVAELGRRCAPFGYPAFLPAAISRADRSTIVLGMDHLHTDAWSTTVVVEDLATRYAAHTRRATARPVRTLATVAAAGAAPAAGLPADLITPAVLPSPAAPAALTGPSALSGPSAPSVLTSPSAQSGPAAPSGPATSVRTPAPAYPAAPARASTPDHAPARAAGPGPVADDDPRLAAWHEFLRARDWALPTFPLPLGVPAGARLPQRTVVRPLADAATADAVAARARAAGASTSAAVLATLAAAVADLGGPARLETLLPVHTRTDAAARRAVGWHTTTVPLRIDSGAGHPAAPTPAWVGPGGDARDTVPDTVLAATGKALRAARELAEVPLEQVVGSLPVPLRFPRRDIFQVSYLDYRRLPGHAAAAGRRAHHVSAATRADDLQVWVSRTDDGVAVRARMPRTRTATETVDALLDRWAGRLAASARA